MYDLFFVETFFLAGQCRSKEHHEGTRPWLRLVRKGTNWQQHRCRPVSLLEEKNCKRHASTLKTKKRHRRGYRNNFNYVCVFYIFYCLHTIWWRLPSVSFSLIKTAHSVSGSLCKKHPLPCSSFVCFKRKKSFNIQRWISLLQINEFLVIGYLKSKFVPLWTRPDFGKKRANCSSTLSFCKL